MHTTRYLKLTNRMTRYLMGPNGIGIVYSMEYNRGASAIGVHRKKIQDVCTLLQKFCYITERAGTFPCTRYRTTGTENSSQDMRSVP